MSTFKSVCFKCVLLSLFLLHSLVKTQQDNYYFSPFERLFNLNGASESISDTVVFKDSYDFVIIGAGSGGSVVANRLSENPYWSVLLLEAGRDEIFLTDIPLLASLTTVTSFNWGYKSEKLSTACLGLINQRCNLPRGKALGGTSVINFLLYTRGNKKDFNDWHSMGNYGWSYEDVLPFFIKSENCTKCNFIDREYHGYNGYLNVENPPFKTPIIDSFLKAGLDLGYPENDPNGRLGLGFSRTQATMRNGARCSASKAFLQSVKDRPNLHISMRSRVTKIFIDPITKQARGVQFLKNNRWHKVMASKEVILSAGSFNSPHILMHSGIGPREVLNKVGIPVIQDLKVGYNLQDHMAMSTIAFLVNQSVTVSDLEVQNPVHVINYLTRGAGPYTIPGGAIALAFVKTKYAPKENDDYPDIELVLGAGAINGDVYGSLRALLGIPRSVFNKVYAPLIGRPAFSIAPVLMRPKSRGRVYIKDKNPLHWPVIEPNYFAEPEDAATLAEGIKLGVSIAQSQPFARFGTKVNQIKFPGCEQEKFGSDAYWICAVRHVATTLGHQVGTCKMGPTSDPDAVVDPELRVYGIKNLRVVDGSIMPNIVAGHTNAVIMMIGEKAADLIKKSWRS